MRQQPVRSAVAAALLCLLGWWRASVLVATGWPALGCLLLPRCFLVVWVAYIYFARQVRSNLEKPYYY